MHKFESDKLYGQKDCESHNDNGRSPGRKGRLLSSLGATWYRLPSQSA